MFLPKGCGLSTIPDAGVPREELSKIVGGWEALPHEFPYQVTLKTVTGSMFCGGSIISSRHVLTAAHCTAGRQPSMLVVGLGEHDRQNAGSEYRAATVDQINQHPEYNPLTIVNDVSVLTLTAEIVFSDGRRMVCPPSRTTSGNADGYAGETLIVSGWGSQSEGGSVADILRAVDVIGLTIQQCRETSYNPSSIADGMNCAGVEAGGKDACQGDSGGPLVFKNGEAFEKVGIVSWGQGCARVGYPGVYADTIYYLDWITANMP
ncbi:hypothetical protein CAPTEDRAFT_103892 [Capitella teleta]|uniref:Peptidase S1 domain-containing protein n=1 Tax=Capitella teleta TaxID=283909 RepID=R7TU68_CAPTE|nr:hypothetical protein CAPTEDRAFT_103892 [Capitella teleta]|eukprot:ELT97142.1 hypothetical protein CAPTEDRAFT_103892 [Capitella teleta]